MKIQHKLMSIPGLAVTLMAVVVTVAAWGLERQQNTLRNMSERQFAANLLALQARSDAAEIHSSVYRLITWAANLDAAKLKEQQTALNRQLGAVEKILGELRAKSDPAQHDRLALAVATLQAYRKQALDAVDLASVDANTGVAAMQTADASYRQLSGRIDEIVAVQRASVAEATVAAASAAETILRILIGVGVLSGVITAIVALTLSRRIVRPIEHAGSVAQSIATGDLSHEIHVESRDETGQLLEAMASMQASLTRLVSSVRSNSENVAAASSQIAQGNNDLSSRTEEQAAALEQTAASMEQLSSTVRQNADNAKQANQLALGASTVAIKGGEVVSQVVTTMKGINDSSKKIADIISVIDGIAFQTNILALNAAVEAARAGEQGRGFAVVASEVRSLAGRSADAAKEIKGLITASVERVEQGTALVDQARTTMTEVVSSIKRVTDIMGEISAASAEQSAGVAQVGEAITQMDQVTQQNAALVEESAAAAESLKGQAQQLVSAVAVFKLSQGEAAYKPTAAAAPSYSSAERRGPERAKNVTRPTFGAEANRKAKVETPTLTAEAAPRKTGTDDEWTSV